MNTIDAEIHSDQIEEAYIQAKANITRILEQKYEFVRSVYQEDLTKMDPIKAEFRLKKAKSEEQFINTMIAYLECFECHENVLSLKTFAALREAKMWNAAYRASITENIEFTKLMIERNGKSNY